MEKVKVGDVLYDNSLVEHTVEKVGNKYFECVDKRGKWRIDGLTYVSEYTNNQTLFKNKQEILDKKEIRELSNKIRSKIATYGNIDYPLDVLRKIYELLTPSNQITTLAVDDGKFGIGFGE
jgi:hypothetical protein